MNTTQQYTRAEDITFDKMLEAINSLPPAPNNIEKIQMCKKHIKQLKAQLRENTDAKESDMPNMIGSLYGIKIETRPYLKKARIYYAK
jgi:hypothetical protein